MNFSLSKILLDVDYFPRQKMFDINVIIII